MISYACSYWFFHLLEKCCSILSVFDTLLSHFHHKNRNHHKTYFNMHVTIFIEYIYEHNSSVKNFVEQFAQDLTKIFDVHIKWFSKLSSSKGYIECAVYLYRNVLLLVPVISNTRRFKVLLIFVCTRRYYDGNSILGFPGSMTRITVLCILEYVGKYFVIRLSEEMWIDI